MLRKLLLVALVLATLLPAERASAEGGITVSPASTEVIINQGVDQVEFDIIITNNDPVTMTARLQAVNFRALDENGGVAFAGLDSSDVETKYSLSSWLGFSKDVVTLEPGKSETIKAIIDNRDSLGPGGHYGAIVVAPINPDKATNNNQVEIVPATAALVLVKKLGGEIYDLKIDNVSFEKSFLRLPSIANIRFQNAGNIHVVPRGTITIYDPKGQAVQKALINTDSGVTLPETFRKYSSNFMTLDKAIWPGRYRAEIAWRYDGQPDFTITEIYLWHIGWGMALLPLLLIIVGLALWISRRKRGKNSIKP
jgi:hypothetical protein